MGLDHGSGKDGTVWIIQNLVNNAAAYNTAHPGYGFVGDPIRPVSGQYCGFLVRAALY